jgi:rod shape determining protein RodA
LRQESTIWNKIDWVVVSVYIALVFFGWLNIYAAVFSAEDPASIFSLDLNSGRQLIWIIASFMIVFVIMTIDFRIYESLSIPIYLFVVFLLILVLLIGREVAGSTSWFELGGFRIQPSEFAKFAVALAVAKYVSRSQFKISKIKDLFIVAVIIILPAGMIILQGDTGTALVFGAFVIVLYREGLNPVLILIGLLAILLFILTLFIDKFYLIIAVVVLGILFLVFGSKRFKRILTILFGIAVVIGTVVSVDYFVTEVLKPHQQNRIKALINPGADPLGYGWNVTQSKVAIGSGGMWGKGYLNGTQTNYGFVPEQSTDFIFCTLGEEHGWIGSLILIGLFLTLFIKIVILSERQKSKFARVYGYSVASILFIHFLVNIGMTIGLFPVIGIPLPFISYGGSSLLAFTVLLFILVKLDAHRMQVLIR